MYNNYSENSDEFDWCEGSDDINSELSNIEFMYCSIANQSYVQERRTIQA
jgi:hypothetical protein